MFPFFSITEVLLVTTLLKINFGIGVALSPIYYLSIRCFNISKTLFISSLFLIASSLTFVIDKSPPFNIFLFVNIRLLSLYRINLMIIGLFLPLLGTPALWERSMSSDEIHFNTYHVFNYVLNCSEVYHYVSSFLFY